MPAEIQIPGHRGIRTGILFLQHLIYMIPAFDVLFGFLRFRRMELPLGVGFQIVFTELFPGGENALHLFSDSAVFPIHFLPADHAGLVQVCRQLKRVFEIKRGFRRRIFHTMSFHILLDSFQAAFLGSDIPVPLERKSRDANTDRSPVCSADEQPPFLHRGPG